MLAVTVNNIFDFAWRGDVHDIQYVPSSLINNQGHFGLFLDGIFP